MSMGCSKLKKKVLFFKKVIVTFCHFVCWSMCGGNISSTAGMKYNDLFDMRIRKILAMITLEKIFENFHIYGFCFQLLDTSY